MKKMESNNIWNYYKLLDITNFKFYAAYHDELISLCNQYHHAESEDEEKQLLFRAKSIIKAQTILNNSEII